MSLLVWLIVSSAAAVVCLFVFLIAVISVMDRKMLRRVALGGVCVFGLSSIAISTVLSIRDPALPDLAQLQIDFPHRRDDLETMRRMSDSDPKEILIEANLVNQLRQPGNSTEILSYGDPKALIPSARWDIYRGLLDPIGPSSGITRNSFGDVDIVLYNGLWRGRYRLLGYTHCAAEPQALNGYSGPDRTPPCGKAQSIGKRKLDEHREQVQALGDGWYAFESRTD